MNSDEKQILKQFSIKYFCIFLSGLESIEIFFFIHRHIIQEYKKETFKYHF